MYVIRTHHHPEYPAAYLCEMSAKELRQAQAQEAAEGDSPTRTSYRPCGAERARAWVAAGRIHETGLYSDYEGRIRYARGEF